VGAKAWGRHAEVYDAEMLELLRGLETAIVFQQAMPEESRVQARIVLFADNTPSVAAIPSERPWASKPMTGCYALAHRIPLFLRGSHAFRTLNRYTLWVVEEARIGHGYFGEYHKIQAPITCPCNESSLQTHEHKVFDCQTHEENRAIITKGAPTTCWPGSVLVP